MFYIHVHILWLFCGFQIQSMDEYGTNLKEYMLLSHNIHVISYNIYIYTYYYMILCSWNIQLFFPCWPPHFRPRSPWDRLTGSMVGTQPSGGRGVRRPGDALISMAFPWVSTGFLRDFYGISMGFYGTWKLNEIYKYGFEIFMDCFVVSFG